MSAETSRLPLAARDGPPAGGPGSPGLVVVGAGLAGYGLARAFRQLDRAASLTVVAGDAGHYYAKPMLSASLSSGRPPEALVQKDAAAMAEELGARVLPGTAVVGADAAAKTLALSDGATLPFARLALAVGAIPRRPALDPAAAGLIHAVNGLGDYARFRAALGAGRRLLILGAGLVGCEFADDAARAGLDVIVVAPNLRPLAGLAPPGLAEALVRALARKGVSWRLGRSLEGLEPGTGGGVRARLGDGEWVEADAALSAIGFEPNLALARHLGLATGRGIAVDGYLRTSHPDIYALGDCAEVEGRWLPFVQPLGLAARALARTLAGEPTPVAFPPMPVTVKTGAYPITILPPPPGAAGEWSEEPGADGHAAACLSPEGRMLGFALGGARARERAAWLGRLGGAPVSARVP